MIEYRNTESVIVSGLQDYLQTFKDECYVVMANQTSPIPPYPYVAYTITTTVGNTSGGYGLFNDGKHYKQMNQIWSFTVQSNAQTECNNIALAAYDYFAHHSYRYLSDNNISVINITNMTSRDNLITAEYEYRQGFDVTFGVMHSITPTQDENEDTIEHVSVVEENE